MSVVQISEVNVSQELLARSVMSGDASPRRRTRVARGPLEIEDLTGAELRVVRPVRSPLDIPDFLIGSNDVGETHGSDRGEDRNTGRGSTGKRGSQHSGLDWQTVEASRRPVKNQRSLISSKLSFSFLRGWEAVTTLISSSAVVKACACVFSFAFVVTLAVAIGTSFLPADTGSIVVQNGDTLWSIASGIEGASTTQAAVNDIVSLNGLATEKISVGQKLILPSY